MSLCFSLWCRHNCHSSSFSRGNIWRSDWLMLFGILTARNPRKYANAWLASLLPSKKLINKQKRLSATFLHATAFHSLNCSLSSRRIMLFFFWPNKRNLWSFQSSTQQYSFSNIPGPSRWCWHFLSEQDALTVFFDHPHKYNPKKVVHWRAFVGRVTLYLTDPFFLLQYRQKRVISVLKGLIGHRVYDRNEDSLDSLQCGEGFPVSVFCPAKQAVSSHYAATHLWSLGDRVTQVSLSNKVSGHTAFATRPLAPQSERYLRHSPHLSCTREAALFPGGKWHSIINCHVQALDTETT